MKISYKVYRSLTGEPFETQELSGKKVEFFYMNDTPYLSQYVSRGRFYIWTSDGNNYRLLVEKGFYEKVSYFFTSEVNGIWIDFLDEVGSINSRMSKMFLLISMSISLVVLLVFGIWFKEQLTTGVIVALFGVLILNMVHTSRINKLIRQKNLAAQTKIREVLTEEKFNQLLKDQEEYYKEYFKFEEDENDVDTGDDELMLEEGEESENERDIIDEEKDE
ncbi:hypothetical protein [Haploplasma axanthum]|uniref:Uncharacterized protein n=1 Tax=Haploplasma axanthum TaxID=29552 RepID=A0A449BBB1_HAPAX|nr:hypothetical protein [Haploplasma axanthum]VEU79651.1 Uncharacterised protein [Haploplasma axanthum]